MFFGASLKHGDVCIPSYADGGQILRLSQACLVNPTEKGRTYLQLLREGEKPVTVCVLKPDLIENASIDLYISTESGFKLQTAGAKNEVHLSGYFEPSDSDDDEDDDDEGEYEEGEISEDETNKAKTAAAVKPMVKPMVKPAKIKVAADDDDDEDTAADGADDEGEDDDDDDDDDEDEDGDDDDKDDKDDDKDDKDAKDDEDDDDDDDDEDEDNDDESGIKPELLKKLPVNQAAMKAASKSPTSSKLVSVASPASKKQPQKQAAPATDATAAASVADKRKDMKTGAASESPQPLSNDKKRKAEEKDGERSSKQLKTEKPAFSVKDAEVQFEKSLVDYLKKNGRQIVSQMATKLRKPDALKETKYFAFLKERPKLFKVEGQMVALAN